MTPSAKSTLFAILYYTVFLPAALVLLGMILFGGPCAVIVVSGRTIFFVIALLSVVLFALCMIGLLRGNPRYKWPMYIHAIALAVFAFLYTWGF